MSSSTMSPRHAAVEPRRLSPLIAAAWVVVGTAGCFALAAAFTPFIVLVVPAAGVGIVLIARRGLTREMLGLGVGLLLVVTVVALIAVRSGS